MARKLVGDWDCQFREIMLFLESPLFSNGRSDLGKLLGTPTGFVQNLEKELEDGKMTTMDVLVEILVEWRSRNPKTATLGALLKTVEGRAEWEHFQKSIKKLIKEKAEMWDDLDDELKRKVLASKIEFQGKTCEVKSLKPFYQENKDEWDDFLSKQVDLYIIRQVYKGDVLKMDNLQQGFIKEQVTEINKIDLGNEKQILGAGCGGTVVYKGRFADTDVAVKKICNFRHHKEVDNEIKFLKTLRGHKNIVQYIISEKHDDVFLLALELCHEKTLKDWVKDPNCLPVKINDFDILHQTTEGLSFLHDNKIIHRDLKPSNILFSILHKHVFVKLADFGISRLLPSGKHSKTVTSFGGTCGWTASEMLEAKQIYNKTGSWTSPEMPKLSKKTDIFSLGCIFYTVLANGRHPFGDDDTLVEHNIKTGNIQTSTNHGGLPVKCNIDLLHKMIAKRPEERPDTEYILAHPIFWSHQKMIDFISKVNNFLHDAYGLEKEKADTFVAMFEESYKTDTWSKQLGWLTPLSPVVRDVLKQRYYYQRQSAMGLVRAIRNADTHYSALSFKLIRDLIGEKPTAFMSFWLNSFPTLINDLRNTFTKFAPTDLLEDFYGLQRLVQKEKKRDRTVH